MSKAADELKAIYEPERDGVYNIAVSGDGTWRRRGFSSSYGVVTALSTVTGGKSTSMNVMRISLGHQEQWMELVW